MKVLVVGGVRPDWINLSVLLPELDKAKIETVLVHTGQHYSYFLDKIFFDELNIREPNYYLGVKDMGHGFQNGELFKKIEPIIQKEKPDLAISFSDANPSLFAFIASKHHIKVAHLEAGMRSNDWRMPEEKNRRMIDSISDIFFCPEEFAKLNLLNEGVQENKIHVVGKLIIDAIYKHKDRIEESDILEKMNLEKNKYVLSVVHRPENTESLTNMKNIVDALNELNEKLPVLAFWHPRTQRVIDKFNLKPNFNINNPIGFFDFVNLQKNTKCTIGDSGGIEEQACYLGTPCVTLRISTERPETKFAGGNIIAGHYTGLMIKDNIIKCFEEIIEKKHINNPYKEGAAKRIVDILVKNNYWINKEKVWWND